MRERIFETTDYLVDEVNRSTAAWTAQAATAYRIRAKAHAEGVRALGEITEIMAEVTLVAGAMVGVVRNTVRDLIAEVVGAAVSKAVQALLVVTIPKIVAEVALMVAEHSARILGLLRRLVLAVGNLNLKMGNVEQLLTQIRATLVQAGDGALLLGASRAQAAGGVMDGSAGTGLAAFRASYGTIDHAHTAVYGTVDQVLIETGKTASRNNAIQNAGSVADKWDDEKPPGPIRLPL